MTPLEIGNNKGNSKSRKHFLSLTGFTLVELIIVIVVLSVGLITLLVVIRNASINNTATHFVTIAGGLAEAKLENIIGDKRKEGFAYIKNSNYPEEDPIDGFGNCKRTVDIYYVELSDLNTQAGKTTDYKRVEVTVNSKVGMGPPVKVVTIVSNIVAPVVVLAP